MKNRKHAPGRRRPRRLSPQTTGRRVETRRKPCIILLRLKNGAKLRKYFARERTANELTARRVQTNKQTAYKHHARKEVRKETYPIPGARRRQDVVTTQNREPRQHRDKKTLSNLHPHNTQHSAGTNNNSTGAWSNMLRSGTFEAAARKPEW